MVYLLGARLSPDAPRAGYPYELPAVRGVVDLDFGEVTVLVGANGSGKSTLVEALAVAAGFNAEGGSQNLHFETYSTHSSLSDSLVLSWRQRPRWGWFLRAETFYGMASHIHLDDDPEVGISSLFPDLHDRSHGESFLTLIESRMTGEGLYLLDEPESALSFHGQLSLLHAMRIACAAGAQFVLATHSPVLMAYPGASIFELTDDGVERVEYDDVEFVRLWRSFLEEPRRFFDHLFDA